MAYKKSFFEYCALANNNFNTNNEQNYIKFRDLYFDDYKGNINKRYIEFCEIGDNNTDKDPFELWNIYCNTKSIKHKKELRYGIEIAKDYVEKLKKRPKYENRLNHYDIKSVSTFYGISEADAIQKIEEHKKKASISLSNAHSRKKKEKYNYRLINPLCKEYWGDDKGYEEYLYNNKVLNSLESFCSRFGEEGVSKYNEYIEKRKHSNMLRYGRTTPPSFTHSSKEANLFFSSLLDVIGDKDFYHYGFGGKREFFLYDKKEGKSYSYDFVDSKNMKIIEYHGSFWHPRIGREFKGIIDYNEAINKDATKKILAEEHGYSVMVVWDEEAYNVLNDVIDFLKEE